MITGMLLSKYILKNVCMDPIKSNYIIIKQIYALKKNCDALKLNIPKLKKKFIKHIVFGRSEFIK